MSQTITCATCDSPFNVDEPDLAFYKKIQTPLPRRCPKCREQHRLVFRNERSLYRRTCDLCKSSIISIYKPEKQITVYCQTCWWKDSWDAKTYAKDYDFTKSFFNQFETLLREIPRCALYNVNSVNSEYCQQVVDNKDCYLCFVMKGCDSCMYLGNALNDRDSYDSSYFFQSELCYECIDSDHLYQCHYCQHCYNSNDLIFCYDLSGCQNCFGCTGLRNKQYYIFNKPYSKEAYFETIKSFELDKHSKREEMKKQFQAFKISQPHRPLWNINAENSSGNNLQNTMNSVQCFDAHGTQDCGYSTWIFDSKDAYDCYGMGGSELVYETIGDEEVQNCRFNTFVTRSSNVEYSDSCFSSHNLFGCVGMKQTKYCILNKQYSKEEYETLVEKIRASMPEYGEFFPTKLSPFDYNETIGQTYQPLTKEEALAKNYTWHEESRTEFQPQTYTVPDSIHDVPEAITKELLACEVTGKNFKITAKELDFYKQHSIPLPRKSPDQRHRERMQLRDSYQLYSQACAKCSAPIQTTYSPESPEKVYCEKCYLEAIY